MKKTEYFGRKKGKNSGEVPHCNFKLMFLVVVLGNSFKLGFNSQIAAFWGQLAS